MPFIIHCHKLGFDRAILNNGNCSCFGRSQAQKNGKLYHIERLNSITNDFIYLADLLHPNWRGDNMATLHAYFDDSADSKHAEYQAVGGLVGSGTQFDFLDILWADATKDLKEPFHATDCETQHGQFEGWEKQDCDELMKQLVTVIRRTDLHGVGFVVPVGAFRAIFPEAEDFDPYFLALRQTLINMAYISCPTKSDSCNRIDVQVMCEDGPTYNVAERIYDELKNFNGWTWGKSLSGFKAGSKRRMSLQASDLVAREAYKHAANLGIRKTRKPVKALHDVLSFHLWTPQCLEYLRDNGGPKDLALLAGWGQGHVKPPQMLRFYGSTFDLT